MSDAHRHPPVIARGPLIRVASADDPRLDHFRALTDPAGRTRLEAAESIFVVEGRLAVERLVSSEHTVCSLLVDDHQVTAVGDLVAAARDRGAPVLVATREVVAETVGFALHRGVVAVAHRPSPLAAAQLLSDAAGPTEPDRSLPLVAVLEGLNDHENIGALFRNAAAFGVAGVLLDPTCADPFYRRSIRVSVGHVLQVPFARLQPWPSALQQVRAAGFAVAALAPRPPVGSSVPAVGLGELRTWVSGSAHPDGVALLLGAEGPGLTDAALAASDVTVSVPMTAGVDSLNVATAAAVAFYALRGG